MLVLGYILSSFAIDDILGKVIFNSMTINGADIDVVNALHYILIMFVFFIGILTIVHEFNDGKKRIDLMEEIIKVSEDKLKT